MREMAAVVIGLVLGAIPTAYWWGRLRGVDLTRAGSGNPGAANAYRVLGARAGLGVLAADVAKGALAVLSARFLEAGAAAEVAAGTASVAGHIAGPFARGRGGKGMATCCGAFLVLAPWATLAGLGVWTLVFVLSRIVSLASMAAALALPPLVLRAEGDAAPGAAFWAAAGIAAVVLVRHRRNIARLVAGREPRFSVHRQDGGEPDADAPREARKTGAP